MVTSGFTDLELAALSSIFSETPDLAGDLMRQLENAAVTKRENSGGGFFTNIKVGASAPKVPKVNGERVLGHETHARVSGLEHGLGFVLFMEDGKLDMLEGFAYGDESTRPLDFRNLDFEVYRAPVPRAR